MLQLPEFPVRCGNLCDLIAGEVESDERKIGQLCRHAREVFIKNKQKDEKGGKNAFPPNWRPSVVWAHWNSMQRKARDKMEISELHADKILNVEFGE